MRLLFLTTALVLLFSFGKKREENSWIRINLLGYRPSSPKVAVWCAKENQALKTFRVVEAASGKTVYTASAGKAFGAYGPFTQSYRLNFTNFRKPGKYYLAAGNARSPEFAIGDGAYDGTADFCLRYMRQQRCGFNPFLKDSCHTHDGFTVYGPPAGTLSEEKEGMHIDATGGWHDASDYLQYVTTSANAAYHLMMAYRDFGNVFTDRHDANGLEGANGLADIMDEAQWGLDWLVKMNPRRDWMFNQLADDRDHMGMRIPKEDTFYNRGFERPVYFITGEPQGLFKYKNRTTGTSSTAAKFSGTFALAHYLAVTDSAYGRSSKRKSYYDKAFDAYQFALKKPGVTQTAPGRAPYFYEEDNWVDDMELASAALHIMVNNNPGSGDAGHYLREAFSYAKKEPVTPWLGADTARHYQWYPFVNLGHYELARAAKGAGKADAGISAGVISYYRQGIERVWTKAKENAFLRGVPFIWCSNNLTVSFATQCYWYRQLSGDRRFEELEQANFDWIFGCNPWGTSMVYGLPSWGDTPSDPHSAFTHLKNYPIDGGLVDGPVYGSIYKNLIGIKLYQPDEYAAFQSGLVVYHDDYGDYSTNEPTMDGTASLIYLLAAKQAEGRPVKKKALTGDLTYSHGAIIRGDTLKKRLSLVFTGDEFAEGGPFILQHLKKYGAKASFFFTGRFYRNPKFKPLIRQIKKEGHYLGAHSDEHLLYCDWKKRDSLLVTKEEFRRDLQNNYAELQKLGISREQSRFFLPPYEWYNDTIAAWTREMGLQLISYTPGTLSHADYTTPDAANYRSSETIYQSILRYAEKDRNGLNGFILLLHIGAGPKRTDKFYERLPQLLEWLGKEGYVVDGEW